MKALKKLCFRAQKFPGLDHRNLIVSFVGGAVEGRKRWYFKFRLDQAQKSHRKSESPDQFSKNPTKHFLSMV